jgi:hypothetical protein
VLYMAEAAKYLGLEPADKSIIVPSIDVNELAYQLRANGTEEVSGVHRMPTIVHDIDGVSVVHPVLLKSGAAYAGFPYSMRSLAMSARRSEPSPLQRRNTSGTQDGVTVTLRPDTSTGADRVGILAYRPIGVTPEQENSVRTALDAGIGFVALHAAFSPTNWRGRRKMQLLGEGADGAVTELPFIRAAAEQFVLRSTQTLRKDLPPTVIL